MCSLREICRECINAFLNKNEQLKDQKTVTSNVDVAVFFTTICENLFYHATLCQRLPEHRTRKLMTDDKSRAYHNTIFWYCNDVEPMRHFYTELLQLEETFYRNDDEAGWLTYQSGTLQVVFMRVEKSLPVTAEWAVQPSYTEGTAHVPSWVIQIPYDAFDATIDRIKASDTTIRLEDSIRSPREGHKSFWVRDPMGTTIEIFAEES